LNFLFRKINHAPIGNAKTTSFGKNAIILMKNYEEEKAKNYIFYQTFGNFNKFYTFVL